MSNFTKGEWKVNSVGSQFSVGPLSSADDQSNGMMSVVAWIEKFDYFTEKQSECNANLIAAAPEMYEFIEGLHESICINGGMVVIDSESIKLLEQLLAKARGENA